MFLIWLEVGISAFQPHCPHPCCGPQRSLGPRCPPPLIFPEDSPGPAQDMLLCLCRGSPGPDLCELAPSISAPAMAAFQEAPGLHSPEHMPEGWLAASLVPPEHLLQASRLGRGASLPMGQIFLHFHGTGWLFCLGSWANPKRRESVSSLSDLGLGTAEQGQVPHCKPWQASEVVKGMSLPRP